MTTSDRHILLSVCCLFACVAVFEATSADLEVQALFFDDHIQQWIWSRTEPVTRLLLYDGIKLLLIAIALVLGVSLFFVKRSQLVRTHRRGICIVFLSLVLVPTVVGAMKSATNVACPRDLSRYGGDVAYTGLVEGLQSVQSVDRHSQFMDRHSQFMDRHSLDRHRCFPAGHASGGFALLSLYFLFDTERNRKRALYAGLLTGWTMGIYKMAIGDHFLSHTVVTMILAWIIANLLARVDELVFSSMTVRDG